MSDRRAWLDLWCPTCGAASGLRCRERRYSRKHRSPARSLHVARGWRERSCPSCGVWPGDPGRTPSGREASGPHTARLRPGRGELVSHREVWEELETRGAVIAVIPFSGRAGQGGKTGTITLSRLQGDELIDVERWSGRDELALALEGPVWDRYAGFAGQPQIRGTVAGSVAECSIVIVGRRGEQGVPGGPRVTLNQSYRQRVLGTPGAGADGGGPERRRASSGPGPRSSVSWRPRDPAMPLATGGQAQRVADHLRPVSPAWD